MTTIILTIAYSTVLFMTFGCGTDVNVEGGTQNEAQVEVNYNAEICDDERFTVEEKLKCIELLTNPEIEGKILADDLTAEQIDEILGVGNE